MNYCFSFAEFFGISDKSDSDEMKKKLRGARRQMYAFYGQLTRAGISVKHIGKEKLIVRSRT